MCRRGSSSRLAHIRVTDGWVSFAPEARLLCQGSGVSVGDATRIARPGSTAVTRSRLRWGYLASTWALQFALLHVYWALGGSWLLASSAGAVLAMDRPTWFVLGGLWGMAVALLAGAAMGLRLARRRFTGQAARLMALLTCLGGACLLLRGVGVEVTLLADAGGVATNVGPDQTHLSLILWNPWFVVGGLAFTAAGVQSLRDGSNVATVARTTGL